MDEPLLKRCLALCQQSTELQGSDQSAVLNELKNLLVCLNSQPESSSPEAQAKRLDAVIQIAKQDPGLGWHGGALAIMEQEHWKFEPIIAMDNAGYVTGWNRGAQILFGYSPSEAIGQHILFLYTEENPGDNHINELFLDHGSPLIEVKRRKKSGEIFRAKLSLSKLTDNEGNPLGLVAHFTHVTDNLSPIERQRLHASIIEDSDEGILIVDRQANIVSVNSAFCLITGYAPGEVIGKTCDLLFSGVHGHNLGEMLCAALAEGSGWHGEIVGKRKNGELFPQSVSIGIVRNESELVSHAFAIFADISILRATEDRMRKLVNYDILTGLPNRSLFNQLLEQVLAGSRRDNKFAALLLVDLSRFTTVNDTLGHEVGDELLRQVAQRLKSALRDQDIIARQSGDLFAIGLAQLHKREHGGLVAEKLLERLDARFLIDAHALHIGAAIGISIFPDDGDDVMSLYRNAEFALKAAQRTPHTCHLFYSPEMNERAKEHWQLEGDLREALSTGGLLLYYQPKASLRTGSLVGAEALLRWHHPTRGIVSPAQFIPLAEETSLIVELGNWILDEACRQIRSWLDAGVNIVPIAVNLSPRQFVTELPERLQAITERHGVPSELLRLEITESLLMHGPEKAITIMNKLVAQGFGLALDDFGTGYSSLAYLKKFPITTLKIDRSFVLGVPHDENDCAIAQAIVTMGKQLRHEIVAEGVETPEQMRFLRDLGCDQLQGYLYSQPLPAADLIRLLVDDRRLSLD